jgi:hypothetical protein
MLLHGLFKVIGEYLQNKKWRSGAFPERQKLKDSQ